MTWRELAACRDVPWFDAPGGVPVMSDEMRRKVCQRCPVRLECRDEARQMREPEGMWGGETAEERLGGRLRCSTIPRTCLACGGLFSPSPVGGTPPKTCSEACAVKHRGNQQSQFARTSNFSTRLGCPLCGDTSKLDDGVCQGWECVRVRKIESRRSVAS